MGITMSLPGVVLVLITIALGDNMRYLITGLLSMQIAFATFAQQTAKDSLQTTVDTIPTPWSFEAAVYHYILPGEKNTTTLLGYADHKALHLETRYNYEDLKTASVFGGYRFEAGRKLLLSITPMIGFVFGNTNGIAPGLEASLTWKKFDCYSESEYVFDFDGKENNFFYTWTELAVTLFRNFRTGISGNRTRLFQSDLDIQKGIFAEYSFWKLTAGVHYFNPFSDEEFVVATLGIEF